MVRADPIRVLVVDDEPELRRLERLEVLRDDRLEVVGEAADGFRALQLIRDLDPDVVVLDISMPGMSGFEVLEQLHGRPKPPAVLVCAGAASEVEARARGADGFLAKAELVDGGLSDTIVALRDFDSAAAARAATPGHVGPENVGQMAEGRSTRGRSC